MQNVNMYATVIDFNMRNIWKYLSNMSDARQIFPVID